MEETSNRYLAGIAICANKEIPYGMKGLFKNTGGLCELFFRVPSGISGFP